MRSTFFGEAAFLMIDHGSQDVATSRAPVSNVYSSGTFLMADLLVTDKLDTSLTSLLQVLCVIAQRFLHTSGRPFWTSQQ